MSKTNLKGIPLTYHSPNEIVLKLKERKIKAFYQFGAIWTVVSESTLILLDEFVIGYSESSQANFENIFNKLNPYLEGDKEDVTKIVLLNLQECCYYKIFHDAITIYHQDNKDRIIELINKELWELCIESQKDFIYTYIAYHYYKTKGWYIRSGIKYGADLVLYERHPSQIHAKYCVIILDRYSKLTLLDLQAMNRLCHQISKRLILFYIESPKNCNANELDNIKKYKIDERKSYRWDPKDTRE